MIYSPSDHPLRGALPAATLFAGSNDLNILAQVRKGMSRPSREYHSGVRPALARVVEHSLAKDPTSASDGRRVRARGSVKRSRHHRRRRRSTTCARSVADIYGRSEFPDQQAEAAGPHAPITKSVTRSISCARASRPRGQVGRGLTVTSPPRSSSCSAPRRSSRTAS